MRGIEQIPWLYDALMHVQERLGFLRRWRAWLAGGATGRVLEVGCGTGRNFPYYPEATFVVGLDPSADALRAARKRAPGVHLVVATVEALPFADAAFDTVISGLVFCSVSDPPRGLAEVARVLAPGGAVRMIEHVRGGRVLGALQDVVQPAWTCLLGGCRPNRDTERAVESAGFSLSERTARGIMRRFVARPK